MSNEAHPERESIDKRVLSQVERFHQRDLRVHKYAAALLLIGGLVIGYVAGIRQSPGESYSKKPTYFLEFTNKGPTIREYATPK